MKDRRYPEGGTNVPELVLSNSSDSDPSPTNKLRRQRRNSYLVPDNIRSMRSTTSDAQSCFVDREFSDKLQKFMLSYSYTLVTTKVLSGEL